MIKSITPDNVQQFGRRIRIGMIGGGIDSVIGLPHLLGQRISGMFEFTAGALSIDPKIAKASGQAALIADDRTYTDWREMLEAERNRPDGIEAVVVATPPSTHLEIARAFLRAGMHVLCEKPLTVDAAQALELEKEVSAASGVFAVGHYFAGYPMIRQAKEMIRAGELGQIRLVESRFAPGFEPVDTTAPRDRRHWRFRPEVMGKAAILGEVGSHAQHMLEYLTDSRIAEVSAELDTITPGREVYDNAYLTVRFDDGLRGRIWNSYVAVGNEHGFAFSVYGSDASLHWDQEDPDHLELRDWSGKRTRLSRGASYLSGASNAESRFPVGHPEGWSFAIANIYQRWGNQIIARELGHPESSTSELPGIDDAVSGMKLIEAATTSHLQGGIWTKL